jgi:hypothetical protein
MTVYSDWLRDFPNRCTETLSLLGTKAQEGGREVTLMLAVGSILLTVPLERLKVRLDKRNQPIDHPMTRHVKAARAANEKLTLKFNAMLNQENFATSPTLWGDSNSPKADWWAANLGEEYDPADPRDWFNINKTMPKDWSVGKVLTVIRNACAHAHILTYSSETGANPTAEIVLIPTDKAKREHKDEKKKEQISRLLFVSTRSALSERPTKFRFVGTTPVGFAELLNRWAAVIPELDPLGERDRGDDEPHLR